MLAFLHYRQQLQRSPEGSVADGADIEEPIRIIGGGIDTKTCSVGWSIGNRHQNIAPRFFFVKLLSIIQAQSEPGTAMVAKQELFQRGAVVEPGSTHKRHFLHLIRGYRNIGVQSHAEGVGKIFPVDNTDVGINELSCKCALDGSGGIVRQLERIPRIVIARTGGDDAQRHSSFTGEDTVDNLVDRAISANDDYGSSFPSSTPGEFFRFSSFRRFYVLCMFAFGATTRYRAVCGHFAAIGGRIEDYKGISWCLHIALLLRWAEKICTDCITFALSPQLLNGMGSPSFGVMYERGPIN